MGLLSCRDADLLAPPFDELDAVADSLNRPDVLVTQPDSRVDRAREGGNDRRVSDTPREPDITIDRRPDRVSPDRVPDRVPDYDADYDADHDADAPFVCDEFDECDSDTDFDVENDDCGECGAGVRSRTRPCDLETCEWGDWGEWGVCACAPEAQTDDDSCGNCDLGTRSRSRTCSTDTCTWSAWSGWTTCSGGGVCSAGARRENASCDLCAEEVCSSRCRWEGECVLAAGSECFWEEGTNWRCCGANRWQFCLPSTCRWSTDCASCATCGCPG